MFFTCCREYSIIIQSEMKKLCGPFPAKTKIKHQRNVLEENENSILKVFNWIIIWSKYSQICRLLLHFRPEQSPILFMGFLWNYMKCWRTFQGVLTTCIPKIYTFLWVHLRIKIIIIIIIIIIILFVLFCFLFVIKTLHVINLVLRFNLYHSLRDNSADDELMILF